LLRQRCSVVRYLYKNSFSSLILSNEKATSADRLGCSFLELFFYYCLVLVHMVLDCILQEVDWLHSSCPMSFPFGIHVPPRCFPAFAAFSVDASSKLVVYGIRLIRAYITDLRTAVHFVVHAVPQCASINTACRSYVLLRMRYSLLPTGFQRSLAFLLQLVENLPRVVRGNFDINRHFLF